LAEEDNKELVDKLKKELAELELEESILRKKDDKLRQEQEILEKEQESSPPGEEVSSETARGDKRSIPDSDTELESGNTYILLEDMPNRSVKLFQRAVKGGMAGLYITRSNPSHVKKKYDLGTSKICWLTGVRASSEILSISGLQELSILVSNAIDENPKTAIFLDGVEYLVSNNDFPIVLRLIQQIRDKVSTSDSVMIIPINKNALDARQLTLLQRECHTIN